MSLTPAPGELGRDRQVAGLGHAGGDRARHCAARARRRPSRRDRDRRCGRRDRRGRRRRPPAPSSRTAARRRPRASGWRRSGARMPNSPTSPPFARTGSSSGRITAGSIQLVVAGAKRRAARPSRSWRRDRARRRAGAARRRRRRRRRNPPCSPGRSASGRPAPASSSEKRLSRSSEKSRPSRPAIAARWTTALVEPPMASSIFMALSKLACVRMRSR